MGILSTFLGVDFSLNEVSSNDNGLIGTRHNTSFAVPNHVPKPEDEIVDGQVIEADWKGFAEWAKKSIGELNALDLGAKKAQIGVASSQNPDTVKALDISEEHFRLLEKIVEKAEATQKLRSTFQAILQTALEITEYLVKKNFGVEQG